jgi:hypothetical protein
MQHVAHLVTRLHIQGEDSFRLPGVRRDQMASSPPSLGTDRPPLAIPPQPSLQVLWNVPPSLLPSSHPSPPRHGTRAPVAPALPHQVFISSPGTRLPPARSSSTGQGS